MTLTIPIQPNKVARAIRRVDRAANQAMKPPPHLSVPEWADRYRRLSTSSGAIGGPFRTSRVEVARGPMMAVTERGVHTITAMTCTQLLKALDVATPIPTPDGWATMGDMRPGSVILSEDGTPTRVVGVSGIMRGKRCFELTFSDGEKVVADGEHLWKVDDNAGRGATKHYGRVIDTVEIAARYKNGNRNNFTVPLAQPLELPDADLPIPPYTFGAWLGDGHTQGARISTGDGDAQEIAKHIQSEGVRAITTPRGRGVSEIRFDRDRDEFQCLRGHDTMETGVTRDGYCLICSRQKSLQTKNGAPRDVLIPECGSLGRELARMGVKGSKHIPMVYLRASRAQRLALLQGLMDTDGTANGKHGGVMFCTTLPELREGFVELARSLGFKPVAAEVNTTWNYDGENKSGIAYHITFTAYPEEAPFRLARKIAKVTEGESRRSETKRRRIVDVRPVESRPVQCIMVDHPSAMFLCGRGFIPTHNTTLLENVIGYYVHLDPAPMLLCQPKEGAVKAFSKERLLPMARATPVLGPLLGEVKARKSDDTLNYKEFPGGFLALESAGSPTNLAMRAIRVTLLDEIDKYETTKEGDPVLLAEERTSTFATNRLKIRACSPTWVETSRIFKSYNESDQRRPFVQCPHCRYSQTLDFFRHVQWNKSEDGEHFPMTAAVYCENCGGEWSEAERLKIMTTKYAIKWRQTKPFICCGVLQQPVKTRKWKWDTRYQIGYACCSICGKRGLLNGHAGYTAGKLYSPFITVPELAEKWIMSKDDPESKQTFYNTQLGQPYEAQALKKIDPNVLAVRCEQFAATVPMGGAVLTAGIDVQSGSTVNEGRLECEVVAWGAGEESWSVDYKVFRGDPAQPALWKELDDYLQSQFQHESGRTMRIMGACIDSGGHNTEDVYKFSRARIGRNIWAIKGASDKTGTWSPVWAIPKLDMKKTRSAGYRPQIIGVNAAKEAIRQRLLIEQPGPGYCHFPADRPDVYFEQLMAENLILEKKAGVTARRWVVKKGRANEAADARVYAYAALCGLRAVRKLNLEKVAAMVAGETPVLDAQGKPWRDAPAPVPEAPEVEEAPPTAPAAPPWPIRRQRARRSSFMS